VLSIFPPYYGKEWVSIQFNGYSGLFPLMSNPGADSFDRSSLFVSAPSQVSYAGLCVNGCCPSLLDGFGGVQLRVFELRLFFVG
jgi:hypothetical protein